MANKKAKLKDGSYYPPEMMGIIYCAAVLEIVLKEHPEVVIQDLLDNEKALPEETPFTDKVNQLKNNLVTIEQTSECLSSHAYSWAIPFAFSMK